MDRTEFDRKYTRRLNPQQQEAVHAVEGAVLLLAVPGSGKTTVLVTRLGYMLCCCGIPADKLARVTEPFYMVDKSRARKQGGSGMGLALCQRIAAVHGGTLQISSQVGVGTTVTVTLPKEVQP